MQVSPKRASSTAIRRGSTMSTRAERSAANRAAHAAKRQQDEARWEQIELAKRAAKEQARRDNRAAWWARYGMVAPGLEPSEDDRPSEDAPQVDAPGVAENSNVEQKAPKAWSVRRFGIDCGYIEQADKPLVYHTPEGESYPVEDGEQATALAYGYGEMARDEARAIANFKVGQHVDRYTISGFKDGGVILKPDGCAPYEQPRAIRYDRKRGCYCCLSIDIAGKRKQVAKIYAADAV